MTYTLSTRRSATFASPSPNCTIGTSKCIDLWETYLEDLGLPTVIDNATEPAITPVPTNRPRCSVGDVSISCAPPETRCIISANKVDLFYWPEPTAAPNASQANNASTTVFRNITMTSPSVYLIFDHLQALTSGVVMDSCTQISPLGATSLVTHLGPAASQRFIGGPYTNAVVSLDPTSLQSLVRDLGPGINTASVASEIAHGGPDYYYWINNVLGSGINYNYWGGYGSNVTALPVNFSDLKVPSPEAYYLNINGPPGCNRMGDHPQCSTIYDGAYRAQLLVPEQVRTLRPEWATCYDPLLGAYDPPIALTPAGSIAKPSIGPDLQTKPPLALTPATTINKPAPGPTISSPPQETSPMKDANPHPTTSVEHKASDKAPEPSKSNGDDGTSTGSNQPAADQGWSNDQPNDNDDKGSTGTTPNENTPQDPPTASKEPDANGSDSNGQGSNSAAAAAQNVVNGLGNAAKETSAADNVNPDTGDDHASSNEKGDSQNDSDSQGSDNSSSDGPSSGSNGSESSDGSHDNGANGGSVDDPNSGSSQFSSGDGRSGSQSGSGGQEGTDSNDGSSTKNNSPEQVISLHGAKHTIAAQNGVPVLDGTTLRTDGSPITVNGQAVSAAGSNVMIGPQTVPLPTDSAAGPDDPREAVFTADGTKITASPGRISGVVVVDGTTLSVDGSSSVVVHGATISAAPEGVVVDGSTIYFEASTMSNGGELLKLGSDVVATASEISSGVYAVGSVTLTAGGPDATISGHTVSAASSGVVIDGSSASSSPSATSDASAGNDNTQDPSSSTLPAEQTTSGAVRIESVIWALLVICGFPFVIL